MFGKPGLFYFSAILAVVGAVGYQYFVKRVSPTISPIISVLGVYLAVLLMTLVSLFFFPLEGGLKAQLRQLSAVQLAIAASIYLIELGFLLMYRSGWNLSTGNLVTGVFINIILVVLGVLLLGEKITLINFIGIGLSLIGVAMISYTR